mmetsp:Transcript_18587/g.57137  ORF Transcript_18587/g.57137 Transcript_18587/m.57137 type:complete len:243 (-) Transcript_18587:77-805(-)
MLRTCVVTGGASGLGRAAAERLVKSGHRVVIADVAESGADVAKAMGATFVRCDVLNDEDLERTLDAAPNASALVNCAGVGFARRVLSSRDGPHSLEDFRRCLEINAIGTFNATRLAAHRFQRNDDDSVVVNTASVAAYDGQIGQAAYAASKGAVVSMTLALARDLAKHRIRVCTVAPGLFKTPFLEDLPETVQNDLAKHVPYPTRLGDPAEFAHLVHAILDNPMLNGETIRLDGALRMPPSS